MGVLISCCYTEENNKKDYYMARYKTSIKNKSISLRNRKDKRFRRKLNSQEINKKLQKIYVSEPSTDAEEIPHAQFASRPILFKHKFEEHSFDEINHINALSKDKFFSRN